MNVQIQKRKELKMRRLSIRGIIETGASIGIQTLLWQQGLSVGTAWYKQKYITVFGGSPDIISILVIVIQLLVSIYFIVITYRKAYPSGITEYLMSSRELPFIKQTQDFPVPFMLGVFTSLAFNALVIIFQSIIHLRP